VPRYEIFTTLAAVAARTRRISFGPGVLLLCLRNPVHVAQAIATLDHLSGGRFVLGVGVGGEHPKEFEASGVAVRERGARTDEALVLLKKLCDEPSVDHDGRFWKLRGISMALRPRGPLAVWIGGRAPAALRRVVTHGDAWFPGFVTPERFRQGVATIEDLCEGAGRDPSRIERGIFVFVGVDREPRRARRQAEEFLSRNYAMPFAPFAPYLVTGAPNECAAGIRRYIDAGVSHVTVRFATAEPLSQLELWSEEVLPALREV
jgi:alkanesulfonate monooxygenase SsuD/methylene tetrahydromethanopterin reductase-like flavin-dependent oxidoreductase (luciferase family)